MKRVIIVLLALVLLLAGCAKEEGIIVDTDDHTISDGSYTYEYSDTTSEGVRTIIIHYPDGNTYTWHQTSSESKGTYSGLFNYDKYTHFDELIQAIVNPGAKKDNTSDNPSGIYFKRVNDVDYMVNTKTQTIKANGYEFTYSVEGSSIRITYPNGAVVSESYSSSGVGSVGWSNAEQELSINSGMPYAYCYDLLSVVPRPEPEEEHTIMLPVILMGLAFIAWGGWEAARPYTHWNWKYGWRYKDAEPSDEALGRIMAGGYIEIALGVVMVIIGIFG